MSINRTISVADLTDQDTVLRALLDMQNRGIPYSLIQDGVEVAKIVPVVQKHESTSDDKVSEEVAKKRRETMAKIEEFSKRVAKLWTSDETSVEAVANNRR